MDRDFLIIAITTPGFFPDEAGRISEILNSGLAHIVHIRKPDLDITATEQLIAEIPEELHHRLKLHDHFDLLSSFQLGGVHLNSRNPTAPPGALSVSRSFHTIEQLADAEHYDYVTLSPIFDSISKKGYRQAFYLPSLAEPLKGRRVVALGGVTPDRIPLLKAVGFFGCAMLGHFWMPPAPAEALDL